MTIKRMRRIATLTELHSLQMPQRVCADLMHIQPGQVSILARGLGLKFSKTWMNRHPLGARNKERVESMAALYRAGYTLAEIGAQYGVSRERVRQLLKKHKGMNQQDGGKHAKAERARKARAARHDAYCLKKYGCTFAQWQSVRDYGRELIASGRGRYQAPLAAFRTQRQNAKPRGISWELTFWQWWTIWQESGHWDERGRGQGYVMCRRGDVGPYAVGNVFIAKATENSAEAQAPKRKDKDLPMGVKRTKSGRYLAFRNVNGVKYRLGTHDTPELAYAAYLMAGDPVARAA